MFPCRIVRGICSTDYWSVHRFLLARKAEPKFRHCIVPQMERTIPRWMVNLLFTANARELQRNAEKAKILPAGQKVKF